MGRVVLEEPLWQSLGRPPRVTIILTRLMLFLSPTICLVSISRHELCWDQLLVAGGGAGGGASGRAEGGQRAEGTEGGDCSLDTG